MVSQRSDGDFLETVRSMVDIREIIAGYIPLKKAAGRYRGLCPFHTEKTPSFYVDPGKQLFYCFGCGTGGDAFRFVMLYEKVEFPEALRMLARRYGVPVPERSREISSEKQKLLKVNQAALDYFRSVLDETETGRPGREYLRSRGLAPETIEQFGIGFSAGRWEGLKTRLLRTGFSESHLLAAGVIVRREGGDRTYDRFRNRVMFPIRNLNGDCVGFGGRVVGTGEPKYLNSPETQLFRKGELLYGLDRTSGAVRKEDRAILVEGYIDFLSLHQAGLGAVVATLGTGFTAAHARLLSRFTRRVVVNFDPDVAGQSAARRSLDVLLESGFEVRVLRLPGGKDPDRFVREEGVDAYRRLLEAAPTYIEYLVQEAAEKMDLGSPAGKIGALNMVLPFVARLESAVERSEQVKLLSDRFRIQDGVVLQELKAAVAARNTNLKPISLKRTPEVALSAASRLVRALIELPEVREALLPELRDEDLAGSGVERIAEVIRELTRSGVQEVTYGRVGDRLADPTDQSLLVRMASLDAPPATPREAQDCLMRLREGRLARRLQELQQRLEKAAPEAEVDDLLRQKRDLRREMRALRVTSVS